MPTVVTETDTFAATVSRPNNGELADSASISLFESVDASRDRYLYNRHVSGHYDVKRVGFGAIGSGAVDDRAAIQAAIDACDAASGGVVWLPGGVYRIDLGLNLPKGVSLVGVPNKTVIYMNHATANTITVTTGTNAGAQSIISGIGFGSLTPNTGYVFGDNASGNRQLIIDGCSVNDDDVLLQGRLAYFTGDSDVTFRNCYLKQVGNVLSITSNLGTLRIDGGKIIMPDGYVSTLISGLSGKQFINNVHFDTTAVVAGTGTCVIAAAGATHVHGCTFDDALANNVTAIKWGSGSNLNASGNAFVNMVPYDGSGGALGESSRLELLPYFEAPPSASTTYTIQSYYAVHVLTFVGASLSLTMPTPLFTGQEIEVFIHNESGGNWAGVTIFGLNFGGTNNITDNGGRSFRARAVDRYGAGALAWVIVGGFSEIYP